ncbi:MAG: EF-hand domain-containing protein [Myxococcota bacterium]
MKRSGTFVAFGLVLAVAFLARAQQAPGYDVKAAFDQTDQNHDGAIEIDEYFDRLVDIFFLGDVDKDGYLTEPEFVAVVVIKEDFTQVDKSGEGKLSREEFVSARLPHFIEIDTDKNSSLSLAEVQAAFVGRSAK